MNRKNHYVKDVVGVVLRTPTIMSQIAMVALEKEELLRAFTTFAKRQIDQTVGNYVKHAIYKGSSSQDLIPGKPYDFGFPDVPHPTYAPPRTHKRNRETKLHAIENYGYEGNGL